MLPGYKFYSKGFGANNYLTFEPAPSQPMTISKCYLFRVYTFSLPFSSNKNFILVNLTDCAYYIRASYSYLIGTFVLGPQTLLGNLSFRIFLKNGKKSRQSSLIVTTCPLLRLKIWSLFISRGNYKFLHLLPTF